MKPSRILLLFATLLLALASLGLRAETAAEPTVHDIYQTASRGDLRGAREMIDKVVARHPGSAKAHYVKAELAARDRDAATARAELQTAEKLAPGLPFVKPEAASALRSQVDRLSAPATSSSETPAPERRADTRRMGAPPPQGSGFPFGLVILAVIVIGAFLLLRRRRAAPLPYAGPNPYARDDAFGRAEPGMYPQQGYPQGSPQGYPQPGYPPQGGGLGSTLGRGLATGLAVGAGAVAAQEIGRRMFEHGHDDGRHLQDPTLDNTHGSAGNSSLARDAGLGSLDPGFDPNADMGGNDFGIADNGGWDDGGGFGDVGGDDWDR